MAPPTPEQITAVVERLKALIDALEAHPRWNEGTNGKPHPTLFYTWDFVNCSFYMLSEYENIKAGTPVAHPEKFKVAIGQGQSGATAVFNQVCSRTMMLHLLVEDTTGKTDMMTQNPSAKMDFGQRVKDAVNALDEVCPEDAMMAGMFG